MSMNRRNMILEWIWNHAKLFLYLPIAAVVIIIGINVYILLPVKQSVAREAEMVAAEQEERQEILYIEETRFSDAEILLQELNKNEPSGGYLVTEEMAMLAQLVQAEAGNQDLT